MERGILFAAVPPKRVSRIVTSLLNIDQLYGSLQSTWDKIRADVFSHFLLFLVLFGLVGVTVPTMSLPKISAQQLMGNDWFELAKETNLLFLVPIAAIVLIVLYGALLRIFSRFLVTLVAFVFLPQDYRPLLEKEIGKDHLLTIALTLDKDDFTLDDIFQRMGELLLLYTTKRKEEVQTYQKNIGKLSKNAYVYAGNASTFLVAWILLFVLLPNGSEWKLDNQHLFWPVTLLLMGAVVWTWMRTRRALFKTPILQIIYVSLLLRSDPDMKSDISQSNERYSQIWERLEKLLSDEEEKQQRSSQGPSLIEFLRYYFSETRSGVEDEKAPRKKPARLRDRFEGFPFSSLYWMGHSFERSNAEDPLFEKDDAERPLSGKAVVKFPLFRNYKAEPQKYAGAWLVGYIAYLYYRIHIRSISFLRRMWQFLLFYLRGGAP
jgi:hypothetical protein